MPMLQVKRVLADMPYSQVSCVNWKRNWQVTVAPDVILKAPGAPDVVPKQPVSILVNRDNKAKPRNGLCAQCLSESKLVGGIKPRSRYRSRSLSASSTDSYSSAVSPPANLACTDNLLS
ncbi:hypothetical protein V5799_014966 [Amblyomma americanum]|uniref:Uncharacterized protein n=1 Tax=Amblyomma americanum TaxID=6943 RepID=A0AAQ4E1I1_AMBAM